MVEQLEKRLSLSAIEKTRLETRLDEAATREAGLLHRIEQLSAYQNQPEPSSALQLPTREAFGKARRLVNLRIQFLARPGDSERQAARASHLMSPKASNRLSSNSIESDDGLISVRPLPPPRPLPLPLPTIASNTTHRNR